MYNRYIPRGDYVPTGAPERGGPERREEKKGGILAPCLGEGEERPNWMAF